LEPWVLVFSAPPGRDFRFPRIKTATVHGLGKTIHFWTDKPELNQATMPLKIAGK
jgi:hypothetical protein